MEEVKRENFEGEDDFSGDRSEVKSESHRSTPVSRNSSIGDQMKKNPWIGATLILGILVLIMLTGVFSGTGAITGNTVSGDDAGKAILDFANSQGANAELGSVSEEAGFHKVILSIQGQEVPIYVTQDGKYFTSSLIPLVEVDTSDVSTQTPPVEIVKSDKPVVELFVWGYCPYGVQAQGPLAEVASLLGDSAEFKTILYYDGHGPFETQQNKIQECIQKISSDKYWDYAAGFVEDIYPLCSQSRDVECDKTESVKLMKSLGINSDEVMSCVDSEGESLLSAASSRAQSLGVTGSPSIVINGAKVQPSSRTAEAYKSVVCQAFNNAPSECDTVLSSDAAANAAAGNC